MTEGEPISEEVRTRDTLLLSLPGVVIGILGAIAERRILLEHNIDVSAAIKVGGATLFGAGLAVNGARKYLDLRRSPKNSGE